MFNFFNGPPARLQRTLKWAMLASVMGAVTLVIGATASTTTTAPLVQLVSEPLYTNGAKTKGNLTLAISTETTSVGAVYRDTFDATKRYVGYFEPLACYQANLTSGVIGNYFFKPSLKGNSPNDLSIHCKSSEFDGNFMNWATTSAIDIFRYGLTGGNRTTDESTGSDRTVVERAWLPDSFYRSAANFPEKFVPQSALAGRTEFSSATFPNGMWIYNCRNRVYFAIKQDTNAASTCDSPFGLPADGNPNLATGNGSNYFYEVRNLICDAVTAPKQLMAYDPASKQWTGLCFRYPGGNYKPVGQLQVNSDALRISVFSYLNGDVADDVARYGGVMRSPLQYVGPKSYDKDFKSIDGINPRAEWDATTGVFVRDPQAGDAKYGNQGY